MRTRTVSICFMFILLVLLSGCGQNTASEIHSVPSFASSQTQASSLAPYEPLAFADVTTSDALLKPVYALARAQMNAHLGSLENIQTYVTNSKNGRLLLGYLYYTALCNSQNAPIQILPDIYTFDIEILSTEEAQTSSAVCFEVHIFTQKGAAISRMVLEETAYLQKEDEKWRIDCLNMTHKNDTLAAFEEKVEMYLQNHTQSSLEDICQIAYDLAEENFLE